MKKFFQELIDSISFKSILSQPKFDDDFKFDKTGWYFFVCPVSGILRIKIIRDINKPYENIDLKRLFNHRLLVAVVCENPLDFSKMYQLVCDDLEMLNGLQKQIITIVGQNKIHINTPGVYNLKLVEDTARHPEQITIGNYGDYYLFNGIDNNVLTFHINNLNSTSRQVDDYLNDPFYYFMYDLDGFMIHRQYVDDDIIKALKIGKVYECKIDFINRNSIVNRQLAIRRIYLPMKISSI